MRSDQRTETLRYKAEAERLREALILFTQMRTDAPMFVQTFSMACFVAEKVLAATRKDSSNG